MLSLNLYTFCLVSVLSSEADGLEIHSLAKLSEPPIPQVQERDQAPPEHQIWLNVIDIYINCRGKSEVIK